MNTALKARSVALGAIAALGLSAMHVSAQEGRTTTQVIDINEIIAGQGIIEIDLNSDERPDFLVEIVSIPIQEQVAIAALNAESEFPPADFILPTLEGGQQATEVALIRALSDDLQDGNVFVDFSGDDGTQFASQFREGDVVGGKIESRRGFGLASTALLYFDTVEFEEPSIFPKIDEDPFVLEGIERSFGPFDGDGERGFVGLSLSVFDPDTETLDTNFGFLEITRGSITVGQQGFQPVSGQGAAISAVPLPAPLAFLAVALLGLFGLRRRAV